MKKITGSNLGMRHILSYEDLEALIRDLREAGSIVGLTSGTWDLKHIGHERYLERLRERVDMVIVGVDSDDKTKSRKGPGRPIVPDIERVEALCHTRHVDFVFIKESDDDKWRLIKTVRPDVLLLSERITRTEEELTELREFCGDVMVVESQAITSTSARVRRLHISGILEAKKRLDAAFAELLGDGHD